MTWITLDAARKLHAQFKTLAPDAEVRIESHPLDETVRISVSVRDFSSGNSAVEYATHDIDPAVFIAGLRKELNGRAKKTRAAIRAENRPT